MSEIQLHFPTAFYIEHNLFDSDQNNIWAERILDLQKTIPSGGADWEGNTYTTHSTFNLLDDAEFTPLLNEIQTHVNSFTSEYDSDRLHVCNMAWGNVNMPGTYQEFHSHPSHVFSCVYYPKVPKGSGEIIFESPLVPDMMPVLNIKKINTLSRERVWFEPKEGTLIIFRSYIRHSVRAGTNTEPRVSIALNYA
jgi:uncharacterized protein (TIGR02466 family)